MHLSNKALNSQLNHRHGPLTLCVTKKVLFNMSLTVTGTMALLQMD